MAVYAIIPIGGVARRMNKSIPKQFIEVEGKSVALHTIEKFQNNENVDHIVIACTDEYKDYIRKECEKYSITKLFDIVSGGSTQLLSIYNCILAIGERADRSDKVIIHVGNRPLVSENLITDSIDKYDEVGMLSTSLPSIEVLVDKENNKVVPREKVVRVQTPQVFSYDDILKVSDILKDKNSYNTLCDLMIDNGYKVTFIDGEFMNFKITYPEDLELFKMILKNKKN